RERDEDQRHDERGERPAEDEPQEPELEYEEPEVLSEHGVGRAERPGVTPQQKLSPHPARAEPRDQTGEDPDPYQRRALERPERDPVALQDLLGHPRGAVARRDPPDEPQVHREERREHRAERRGQPDPRPEHRPEYIRGADLAVPEALRVQDGQHGE